ncbi:unnamed protein product [Closterium sp. Naga37s-1]|nr:unnamed protein product [Closterium sp. Naga37s-1]
MKVLFAEPLLLGLSPFALLALSIALPVSVSRTCPPSPTLPLPATANEEMAVFQSTDLKALSSSPPPLPPPLHPRTAREAMAVFQSADLPPVIHKAFYTLQIVLLLLSCLPSPAPPHFPACPPSDRSRGNDILCKVDSPHGVSLGATALFTQPLTLPIIPSPPSSPSFHHTAVLRGVDSPNGVSLGAAALCSALPRADF